NVIDLSGYSAPAFLQQLRGNAGNDLLIGTSMRDTFTDGSGSDIIVGGAGNDSITLTETRTSGTQSSDIVKIGVGESTVSAWDVIGNSSTNPTASGFDITSATAADHDRLDLPSNVIAADIGSTTGTASGTVTSHSITSGIVTFNTLINTANLSDAISYLVANITTAGNTVAFRVDTDNSGTIVDAVDSLFVFQDGGANPDILVQLAGLGGINSATLGTAAGANVVQLVTSVPTVVNVTSVTSAPAPLNVGATVSIQVTFSEIVTVDTTGGTPQLTLETGATDWAVDYVSGSGTATLHFTYTVQAGDVSPDLDYFSTGALVLNGATIKDATGTDTAILTLPTPGTTGSLGANRAIVVDTATGVPAAPSTPDLAAASDSGSSNTDNITNDTTPTLTGSGAVAATVTLFDTNGTTVLGT
ncbi:MAG: Ig-like domain-containing protein, partial [Gammaproteobacteria bacterium]|nr:Ig-like domain-containing protein [Gammaproteobacteria bacterium]